MKKKGRNDPCPCGSGKKYKKCCRNKKSIDADSTVHEIPQIYQLVILKYFSEGHIDLESEQHQYQQKIFTQIDSNLLGDEFLKAYIKQSEEEIRLVASKYNIYDLLFWSRRLAPKNIFDVHESSVRLYREIQSLSIYKYGKSNENIFDNGEYGVVPSSLREYYSTDFLSSVSKIKDSPLPSEIIEILSDVIRLELLSYLFLKATQTYRIINKGGIFLIDAKTYQIHQETSDETGFLIDLYDERLSKTNLLSMIGAYSKEKVNKDKIFFPHFILNVDHQHEVPFMLNPSLDAKAIQKDKLVEQRKLNYLVYPINISNLYKFLSLFEEEFQEHYSFKVRDFIVLLGLIAYRVTENIFQSLGTQIQIYNRAYFLINSNLDVYKEDYIEKYNHLLKLITGTTITEIELSDLQTNVNTIFDSFTLTHGNQSDLDLWTRGPKRLFYQMSKHSSIIDYTMLTGIVAYIVKEITSTDGEVGNRRAEDFEDSLIKEIKHHIGEQNIWVAKQEIKYKGQKKQIDASFIREDILFILEAKAVNVSFGFDKGNKNAVEYRTAKMKKAIKESNQKAKFIKQFSSKIQPSLPQNIRYICPLAISSYPEFIWEKSDELFLSVNHKIPRILTVNDIKDLSKLSLDIVRNKDWVIKI